MAEQPPLVTYRRLNRFKNNSSITYATTDISDGVLQAISTLNSTVNNLTGSINTITGSFGVITGSLNGISKSLDDITNTVNTHSVQISDIISIPNNIISSDVIYVNKEIPSGSIDGINSTYVLEHTPTLGSEHLYLNGVLIEEGTGTDYHINGSTIIFDNPLLPGMKLHCTYHYSELIPVKIFVDKEIPLGLVDNINPTFSLTHTPIENSEHLYLNGVLQESGPTADYTISGSTIVFADPPKDYMKMNCTYHYILYTSSPNPYYYKNSTTDEIFIYKETPSGLLDNTNNTFTLAHIPAEGSEHLYLNGVLQESGATADYIISGSTITFSESPKDYMKIRCTYYYLL